MWDKCHPEECGNGICMAANGCTRKLLKQEDRYHAPMMDASLCRACGDCKLGSFGGICPVTICAKGLLNGPCGGSKLGKCEAGNDKDCAWELIYQRLSRQGKLDNLKKFVIARDHKLQAHPLRSAKE